MRKTHHAAAALTAAVALSSIATTVATAAPLPLMQLQSDAPASVEKVADWRYHRNCGWRDGRWVVDLGIGRIVTCRPYSPGREYRWRTESDRSGWYNPRRRMWHESR